MVVALLFDSLLRSVSKACGDGVAEQQALEQQQQEQAGEVKRDDLVCGKCSDFSAQANCSRHGSDYIEYKCKYCWYVLYTFVLLLLVFCDGYFRQPRN